MPYINVNMTKSLTPTERDALAAELGKAVTTLPGKSEMGLMIDIEDGKALYNNGVPQDNCVYMSLSVHGCFSYADKDRFTAAVFEIFTRRYGVEGHNMYLNITEHETWGVFGKLQTEPPSND